MSPDEYCQQKTQNSGSSFYYSFLFLPEDQRRAITALYAFCREVDDIVDESSAAEIAKIKLQWWRETIHKTFLGNPEHPIQQALIAPITRFNLSETYFQEIINGMEMDLDKHRYSTFSELSQYCYRVASVVGLMAAEIFGYHNKNVLDYAKDLGMAFQLTNIFRDVKEDAARGRIYIPLDEMKNFNVSEKDILTATTNKDTQALLRFQGDRARHYYNQAFAQLPEQDRYSQRSGLIMAAIYLQTLVAIENGGYRVFDNRISLSPLRKLWLAWRTLRTEKKRYNKLLFRDL